ncbi:MAG: hypothetical protein KAX38_06580, partial [Candidatus Krumholzibacteria bacterium]|nr:hypothetical protein [Candidatus Krumholzibacteria bacterium]
ENYGVLRSGSRSSYRRALYSAVFALALRVVSTVDAVRLARGEDRSGGKHESDVSFDLGRRSGGLSISFKKSF